VSVSSFLEAPERVAATAVRRRWGVGAPTAVGIGVALALALAAAAGVTYYIGWCGSYEHRLTASVRHLDCKRVTADHDGWAGGADLRALNARAIKRFSALCEELGPMVTWLRFRDATDMHRALATTPRGTGSSFAFSTVCVSNSRAEVVLFEHVGRGRIAGLCGARDGQIVHRQPG
jgi:hypothetical protein